MLSESDELEQTNREILIGMKRDIRYIRERFDDRNKMMAGELANHEKRISSLERYRWWIAGAVMATGTITSILTALFEAHIR